MAISKVIFNGVTQMDVTGNTVTANTLVSPETATKADGTEITGSLVPKSQSDLTVSGATVTVPAGVYSTQATKSVSSGSATPASSISGTGASVSSSSTTITLSKSVSNTPTVSAGYISSGTSGSSSVSLSATDSNFTAENIKKDVTLFGKTGSYEGGSSANIQSSKSYTVSASGSQTISPDSGYDAMGEVALTVPAQTLPTTTSTTGTGTNLLTIGRSTSTRYLNIPTGYNGTASRYTISSVANGSASPASTITGTGATVTTGTNTITLSKSVSNTPTVSAGYISSGTAGNSSVSLTASVAVESGGYVAPLASTVPSSNQTVISAGTYVSGDIYISQESNFIASNVKKDVTLWGLTGTYEGSGGATNFVTGTFTTGSSTSTVESLSITYGGSGYPIMLAIWVEGGCYNSSGASGWYNSLTRYAVGQVIITKGVTTSTPTYTTSGAANYGTIQVLYKNSTSSATSYSSTRASNANSYSSSNANGTSTTCVRWKGNKSLSYYVSGGTSSTYGLLASTTYRYVIYYSA